MNPPSRNLLDILGFPDNKSEKKRITQELADRVFANKTLSLAEETYVCGILKLLRNENGEKDMDISEYKSCKNYLFKSTYLKYFQDLNGHKKKLDYDGEISLEQKKKDVAFLEKEYIEWEIFLRDKTNGNDLINYISQETNYQIKELKKYCNKLWIGNFYHDYLKKSLILHGKFIYLLVKEFYQEIGVDKQIIEINNKKILIDSFTYVHTMFRHYASSIKDHQQDKTYHFNENIGHKTIPNTIYEILSLYKSIPESIEFDNKNINFSIDGKPYSIWLRPYTIYAKGNIKENYSRVQTFYPINHKKELEKLKEFKIVKTTSNLEFFIKNVT